MLNRVRCVGITAAVALAVGAGNAVAATPSAMLAKSLKRSMQAYYDKSYKDLEITRVTCTIATGGAAAHCAAHFTLASQRALGVFQLSVKINTKTGGVSTKTTSVKCKDSKTGAPVGC